MSRIGKKPIILPKGVSVSIQNDVIQVKGAKGTLQRALPKSISVSIDGDVLTVERKTDARTDRALHGLMRSLIANMVTGVSEGFSKTLDIVGVGYKAEKKGDAIVLSLGYSHPIEFVPPSGVTVEVPKSTQIVVSGIDKEAVGQVSAIIRGFRKPEPYKGKGIKYLDEVILRKAGKTGKSK
ncbi:MAG: 50S ribosomal protein L6 [bacterium]|nr:50S ribosomal protein L6 [bacterium]